MNNTNKSQTRTAIYPSAIIILSCGLSILLAYLVLSNQSTVRSQLGITSQAPEIKDWQYYQAETRAQMAIDSQLVGNTKYITQGGCNCPYCCAQVAIKVYK